MLLLPDAVFTSSSRCASMRGVTGLEPRATSVSKAASSALACFLALASLAHLPREWRGKRYRRTEGQSTEHAREEGERLERLKQGRQVAA